MAHIHFQDISFSHGALTVIDGLTVDVHPGWTGIVGANGAGKTTLLKLMACILNPSGGSVSGPIKRIYLPQKPDTDLPGLEEFFYDWDEQARSIRESLGVKYGWFLRLSNLSSGELKRVQVAWALWNAPEVLLADEPTNHMDGETRRIIMDTLGKFEGIGVLVSHNRALLDNLCSRCFHMQAGIITPYRGGYTAMMTSRKREQKELEKKRSCMEQKVQSLRREAAKHRDLVSRAHRIRSKRNISRKDHDAKEKIDIARITGKDRSQGKKLERFSGRIERMEEDVSAIRVDRERSLYFAFKGSPAPGQSLISMGSRSIPLDAEQHRQLLCPEINIKTEDRILITGKNGSGKTTLLETIRQAAGSVRLLYLPQELTAQDTERIRKRFEFLDARGQGFIGSVIDRLGSDPERILASSAWSPGELRKMFFALGLLDEPECSMLDEPMNHLDLPSIECFEEALASVPVALLLVTHDEAFIGSWVHIRWHIEGEKLHI